ncbi:site-specific DNA-methyltransferase [Streptococcus mutans]|uniref:site-specific DNA-methyltransferase n=1 Tax=Streptococcus mutans TaxID=1309 RepID=UPI0002B518CD|nr:site-specific DNA-methyltransferase [Streptococcus mutans]EMB59149.1 Site-specific DNA-methyltransferase (adenine- specific) [Streptococcus mutans 1SM1]
MPATFNERPHQNEKAEVLAYVRSLMEQARKESNHEDLPKLEKLIELIDSKRYGLVWEEHAELVEEEMKSKIPVFVEDESRKIKGNLASEDYHFLLEGDNLHSLHLLEKTHAGKIDVIYIDPPYNTGNKDFIYNDKIVDKNDGYSHSKWLSFMSKRLEIAQNLLSETGVIFISIDDNEQAQLKLLCDEVFGEENLSATFCVIRSEGGGMAKQVVKGHEYCFVFAKNLSKFIPLAKQKDVRGKIIEKDGIEYWIQEDWLRKEFGKYGNCHYEEIIEFKGQDFKDAVDQKLKSGEYVLLPKSNGLNIVGKLRRLDQDSSKFYSIIKHLNKEGVKEVRGAGIEFSYPKPISLVKDLVKGATFFSKKGIILDFFAGSGTTGHAVAQLNKEDGGNRKYILCTNNENNICEEVTYKRLANIQEDLPHNLKYFKTQFIEKEDEDLEYALLNNVKTLIELEHAIDLEESDKAVAFTLSEIRELDLTGIKTVYVRQHSHALMEKEDRVRYEGIELIDVPEYYFAKEMKEAGL